MRIRFAALFLVLVATGTAAAAGPAPGPTGLHGFLLQADEPATTTFHRTPSFAWNPVPGATRYQFQLSTSSDFRENAVVYNTNSIVTPVAAPSLVLPWITGSPHSLYARVRATVTGGAVTQWSEYGFDVTAPAPPTPLPTDPGLLRWTPVQGATEYQVWLIDVPDVSKAPGVGKQETVHTNVLDEREFYTFHQSSKWISTVRWRVRAVRSSEAGGPSNGLPATTYGAWSSIYSSSNPAVSGGPITLLHTISDVTSDGSSDSAAHRLMPGFTWKGNQTLSGQTAELFRVYVFTDAQCLNEVYESPAVGSPAYAPRLFGPLALPSDSAGIATARGEFLPDGPQPQNETFDGSLVNPQEQAAAAAPTLTAPPDLSAGDQPVPTPPATGGTSSGGTSTGGAAPSGAAPAAPGAPVDLWDTDYWPKGGYYWVVVGVQAVSAVPSATTVSAPGASKSSTLVPVTDTTQFSVGESITIGVAPNSDTTTITAIGNGLITLSSPLNFGHAVGEPISSTASSGVVYRDMELPQDVCKSGGAQRESRFGIASEAPVTAAQDAFATGLSPTGHLFSASQTATFYGQPLVAWPPIMRGDRYEIEWSSTSYPFNAQGSIMTPSTSVMLPVAIGTWYYRVRAFDDNLPTGAQSLGWSDTSKIVVAGAKFRIVKPTKNKFKIVGNG
jgi:hypothetical protein